MKIKNQITRWSDGAVIFENEKEDNTIKDTVEEAVKNKIDLSFSNLRGADLRGADLHNAILRGANLRGADLRDTDLRDAVLHITNICGADLRGANVEGANMRMSSLCGANLRALNLYKVNLDGANLYFSDLRCTKNIPSNIYLSCPSDGSFIGWKKISCYKENYKGPFLVKILIPEDAKRSSSTGVICRCDKAKVLEIISIDTGENVDIITNLAFTPCIYKVGEMVYPDSFDEDRWNECSHGIHFFIEKQLAIYY